VLPICDLSTEPNALFPFPTKNVIFLGMLIPALPSHFPDGWSPYPDPSLDVPFGWGFPFVAF
jgi:hypothetical protein